MDGSADTGADEKSPRPAINVNIFMTWGGWAARVYVCTRVRTRVDRVDLYRTKEQRERGLAFFLRAEATRCHSRGGIIHSLAAHYNLKRLLSALPWFLALSSRVRGLVTFRDSWPPSPSAKKPFHSFFFGLNVQLVINPLLLKSLSIKCHLYDPHEYIEYIYLSLTSSCYYHTIISYCYIVIPNCN